MEGKQRVWESLRNDARQAESIIERQISVLESLLRFGTENGGSNVKTANDGSVQLVTAIEMTQREFDRQRNDVELALQRFESLIGRMAEAASAMPPESTVQRHTDRFLQLAAEMRRTVTRLVEEFRRRREKEELLLNVSSDLEAHREGAGVRLLLEEQQSLRHTQRRLNDILANADASREKLRDQRDMFMRIESGVVQIAQRVPLVKKILGRIDSRRRREAVVLGLLVGICMLLLFFFW